MTVFKLLAWAARGELRRFFRRAEERARRPRRQEDGVRIHASERILAVWPCYRVIDAGWGSLVDLQSKWNLGDLLDACDALDALDEAKATAAKPKR
jgi:hypothetical protein